jgi:hypothetical protein
MQERDGWRSWAQFVYLGGGPVNGTDSELQAAVCAAQDAREQESVAHLRAALENIACLDEAPIGASLTSLDEPASAAIAREALSVNAGATSLAQGATESAQDSSSFSSLQARERTTDTETKAE